MKIRYSEFSQRRMWFVRGAACAVLLVMAAGIGGTAYAGVFGAPWEQPREPNPAFARQVVAYATRERPGTIIVDPANHFLYVIHDAGQAIRYGVGVGAEGFLWSGRATVHNKQEWPDWYPPAEMLARKPELREHMVQLQSGIGMKGGPDNPIGARALYLWSGNKDTLYRIHGTNEPGTIGTNVSSGCIRLTNEDIVDLYNRTPIGAKVVVFGTGRPVGQ
jgi:lipoprotein-anchoring transpeptidase ErfK/SrfK